MLEKIEINKSYLGLETRRVLSPVRPDVGVGVGDDGGMYNCCCCRSHSLSLYTIIVREEREEKKKEKNLLNLEACSRLNPLLCWPLSMLVLVTMVACVIIVVTVPIR